MTFPLKVIGFLKRKVVPVTRVGLIGEWLLNGSAWDTSTNSNDGTITNGYSAQNRHGVSGTALTFSGSGWIDFDDFQTLLPFSLSAWVYPTNVSVDQWVVNNRSTVSTHKNWQLLVLSDAHMYLGVFDSSNNQSLYDLGSVTASTWYNVICTTSGVSGENITIKLGAFGGSLSTIINENLTINMNTSDTLFQMCKQTWQAAGFFEGLLDDVRIWNALLTDDEMTAIYDE